MQKQQAITETPKQLRLPLWKRLTLVTALLLSGGPLTVIASTQAAYASPTSSHQHTDNKPKEQSVTNIIIKCIPGKGGKGGEATKKSSGAVGGRGGDCVVTIPIKVLVTEKTNVQRANNVKLANNVVSAGTVVKANTVSHR
jgi:hypothetical protein